MFPDDESESRFAHEDGPNKKQVLGILVCTTIGRRRIEMRRKQLHFHVGRRRSEEPIEKRHVAKELPIFLGLGFGYFDVVGDGDEFSDEVVKAVRDEVRRFQLLRV